MRPPRLGLGALALVQVSVLACIDTTAPDGTYAQVAGGWTYTGTQAEPARQLEGDFVVSNQNGDLITGTITFLESDGVGNVDLRGGPVSGRVIETTDVDFDLTLGAAQRRHVARISANGDTIQGVWVQPADGLSGTFLAIRQPSP